MTKEVESGIEGQKELTVLFPREFSDTINKFLEQRDSQIKLVESHLKERE